jgi:hypothetical protein
MSLELEGGRASVEEVPTGTVLQRLSIRARQITRRILAGCIGALESIRDDDEDLHCDEAYFWMSLYNAALLEGNSEKLRKKTQLALRAVEGRRRCMTPPRSPASVQEWNLLQYAAIVLKRIAKNSNYERTQNRPLQSKEAA